MYRGPVGDPTSPLHQSAVDAAKAKVDPDLWRALGFDPFLAQSMTLVALNEDLHGWFLGLFPEGLSAIEKLNELYNLQKAGLCEKQIFYMWPTEGRTKEQETEKVRALIDSLRSAPSDRKE
jgi:hypothetical protein